MEPNQTNVAYPPPIPNTVFGTRIPTTVCFAVAVLLFFLPFAQVKCNGTTIVQNTGLGIAIGSEWKATGFDTGNFGDQKTNTDKPKKQGPNIYAIAALGLGVLGLLISFGNAKSGGLGSVVTGLLSAGALIGLLVDLKNNSDLKAPATPVNKPANDMFGGLGDLNNMRITLDFTPWFYIAVIGFLAAAFFGYKRLKAAYK